MNEDTKVEDIEMSEKLTTRNSSKNKSKASKILADEKDGKMTPTPQSDSFS